VVKTAATAAHREHKAQSKGRLGTRVSGTNPERALENACLVRPELGIEQQKTPDYRGFSVSG
jgi:hypothetical protein